MGSKKGSLTVEASIALTAFMFIVIIVLSFSTVYRAHSVVSHATMQTSQSLAIESYFRETISGNDSVQLLDKMIEFAELIGVSGATRLNDEYASLGNKGTDFYGIVKEMFAYSIAEDIETADQKLENLGIVGGLDGINFAYSAVKDGNIIINVRYKMTLPFSFFGERTIDLSKSAMTKAFKKIEDNNGYAGTE